MTLIRRTRLALTAGLLAAAFTAAPAQRTRTARAAAPAPSAQTLMSQYRFDEALTALQRDLAAAHKAGRDTYDIEDDIRRARLGADMLRATQRVTFVDSVKTTRGAALAALRLGKGCGTLSPATDITDALATPPAGAGRVAYTNALGDKAWLSVSGEKFGEKTLSVSYLNGTRWSKPSALPGLDSLTADADCPFVMPDGVTLYFAAEGEESLGGYDLFVTRYDNESKSYLRAENLGMPFNSPANDYLLAIDEDARLGWLVTDRNQQGDTVCVYVFVPEETYAVWQMDSENATRVRRAAMIAGVAESQYDAGTVKEAKKRLAARRKTDAAGAVEEETGFYVIDDTRVYTSLRQFASEEARGYARRADEALMQLRAAESRIDLLQRAAKKGERAYDSANMLSEAYDSLPALRREYNDLCKKMREAELAAQ